MLLCASLCVPPVRHSVSRIMVSVNGESIKWGRRPAEYIAAVAAALYISDLVCPAPMSILDVQGFVGGSEGQPFWRALNTTEKLLPVPAVTTLM